MLKCIAIIPARGGSKRIPKKNIKDFHGKPIISYTIQTALKSKLFDKVIVSTDDDEIAKIAKECGADVPFLRPKELSDDYTGIAEVIDHAINFYKKQNIYYDYSCLLYATSPFLKVEYLYEGLEKLKNSDAKISFAATLMPFPIQRTFKITSDNRCEMFWPEHYYSRSQDLEEAYHDAVLFSWSNLKIELKEGMIGYSYQSIPIIIPRHFVQDIDTLEDWENAEILYSVLKSKKLI